jgi:hypothetical protein
MSEKMESTDKQEKQSPVPFRQKLLGFLMTTIAVLWLLDSTLKIVEGLQASMSSIAVASSRATGILIIACLMWVASFGLFFRKSWARWMLIWLLLFKGLLYFPVLFSVIRDAQFSSSGMIIYAIVGTFYGVVFLVLVFGRSATPVPAPRISGKRIAAALCLIVGTVSLLGFLARISDPTSLEELPQNCQGELSRLRESQTWVGERIAFYGIEGKKILTRKVKDWTFKIVPEGKDILRIEGFEFAANIEIRIDTSRNALMIHKTVFVGSPITGNSSIFGNKRFEGVSFEGLGGRVYGDASILFFDDGTVALSFDKVFIDGLQSREYGTIRPLMKKVTKPK